MNKTAAELRKQSEKLGNVLEASDRLKRIEDAFQAKDFQQCAVECQQWLRLYRDSAKSPAIEAVEQWADRARFNVEYDRIVDLEPAAKTAAQRPLLKKYQKDIALIILLLILR